MFSNNKMPFMGQMPFMPQMPFIPQMPFMGNPCMNQDNTGDEEVVASENAQSQSASANGIEFMKTMQHYQMQMMTMMMDYMNKVMQMIPQMSQMPFMSQMPQTPFMPQMPFMGNPFMNWDNTGDKENIESKNTQREANFANGVEFIKAMQRYQIQMMTMMMDNMNKVMQMMPQMGRIPQMPFMPQIPFVEQLFQMPFMKMFNIPEMDAKEKNDGFPFSVMPKQVLQQLLHMEASPEALAMLQQFLDKLFELYSKQV